MTREGKYNYNAYLLADENNISIKLVKYLGTNKMELIENHEYGYCCIITATNRILEAYDKSCFIFMDHFLRVSFKYRENPFEYDNKKQKNDKINDKEKQILKVLKVNPSATIPEIKSVTKFRQLLFQDI